MNALRTALQLGILQLTLLSPSTQADIKVTRSSDIHFGELEFNGATAYGEISMAVDGSLWISSNSNIRSMKRSAAPGHIVAEIVDVPKVKLVCSRPPSSKSQIRIQNTKIYWVQTSEYFRCGDILHIAQLGKKKVEIELLIVADLEFLNHKAGQGIAPHPLSIELEACSKQKKNCS